MSHPRKPEPDGTVHEFEAGRATEAVVEAIAVAANADPLSIDPLYDAVDTDALDSLFRSRGDEITVGFSHEGFTVEVQGQGTIRVVPESH